MNLSQIVCSREWAERLEKAGWPQRTSLFRWCRILASQKWVLDETRPLVSTDKLDAPTGTELLAVKQIGERISTINEKLWYQYLDETTKYALDLPEPDARATQVVWMLQHKIIAPEDIVEVLK